MKQNRREFLKSASVAVAALTLCFGCVTARSSEGSFAPEFYAFLNGLPAVSFDEEAKLLKELGYNGVATAHGGKLSERIAAYDKYGMKVLSLYLAANKDPIHANVIKALENRDAMIELTVHKITPEILESIRQTADMAEKMNVRVTLYPHHGFAIATVPQALDLVAKVNHSNLGMTFNLCHFLKCEKAADLESVLEQAGSRLFSVSTCGADTDGTNWGTLIQPLDKGTFPQKRLLEALQKIDYRGPVGLQCYAVKGDKRTNLKASIGAWKQALKELGKRD